MHSHTLSAHALTHTHTRTHTVCVSPAATVKANPPLQKAEQLMRQGEEAEVAQDYQAALQCYIKAIELMLPVAEGAARARHVHMFIVLLCAYV